MASRKSTARVEPEPVTVTFACESERHWLCKGTVLSLTAPLGQQCICDCHLGDDRAIDLAKEQVS